MRQSEIHTALAELDISIEKLYWAYVHILKADEDNIMGKLRNSLIKNIHGLEKRRNELIGMLPIGKL